MKQLFTLTILLATLFAGKAQISLSTTNMPYPGWTHALAKDTSIGAISWGSRGANQVYNFANLQNNLPDSVFYLTPTNSQLSAVPTATIAVTQDRNTYLLGSNTATKFDYRGLETTLSGYHAIVSFNPVDDQYLFPTAYSGKFGGSYGYTTTANGSAFSPSLPVNKVRVTNTTTYKDTIDGWGKVTTPIGSYKCLRQKRIENSSTVIDVQATVIPVWTNYQTINTATTRYFYLTKETRGTVITFTYDSANNPLTASYSTIPPSAPMAHYRATNGAGGAVAFVDSTDGYPDTYSWSFGDNTPISTTSSPNHTYTANGNYVACLTVTNAGGSTTYCDTIRVTNAVGSVAPVAKFGIVYGASGAVTFIDSSTGTPNSYSWSFGDASQGSTATSPSHTYTANGNYAVCLTVMNGTGSSTHCDTVRITNIVTGVAPVAKFRYVSGAAGVVTFIDSSTGSPTTWSWNFGDQSALGTAPSPTHTYTRNGKYTVCLTVGNARGRSLVCDSVRITNASFGVGIDEIPVATIQVYPNPTTGIATLSNLEKVSHISITDVLGRQVKTIYVNGANTIELDMSREAAGLYIIMTNTGMSSKLLKE